jgi:hypothetical protein
LTLIFGGDTYDGKYLGDGRYKQITPEPATLEVGMTEVNFSNKNLGMGGAIIISAWLTHKDNGAMSKLTFGDKQGQVLALTTEMTEANFSGKLKSYEALIVAAFLPKCT